MVNNPFPHLKPGSKIALIAPASHFDHGVISKIERVIQQLGFDPVHSQSVFDRWKELAGRDWVRAEDFIRWFVDPDVSVVWAIRGGYGSSRIINLLNPYQLATQKKIFIGYSDITFLHLVMIAGGFQGSVHGLNAVELADASEGTLRAIQQFLNGTVEFKWRYEKGQIVREGVASGRLIGGNLTCLCHLLGTSFLPNDMWNETILFLEDHNEAGYRIDRMLNHLKLAGIFDKINGLVLGSFRKCEPFNSFYLRIVDILAPFEFPIICGMPFGHGIIQDFLPLGRFYHLDTFKQTLEMING